MLAFRIVVATSILVCSLRAEPVSSDVVVYGATAGGVIASIAAATEGAKVSLLSTNQHVGGMVTGGLGRTDMYRQPNLIGGLAREFFQRLGRLYGEEISWFFEPKVAEKVLRDWLTENRSRSFTIAPCCARVKKERALLKSPRETAAHTGRLFSLRAL